MPCIGLMSFSRQIGLERWRIDKSCVNALYRAHVFFTPENWRRIVLILRCVNALYRAHVFFTLLKELLNQSTTLCQCPVSGSCLFHKWVKARKENEEKFSVNALYRAHVFFTDGSLLTEFARVDLVSMPCIGLMSFSLHPL